jgi:hypothetical protein
MSIASFQIDQVRPGGTSHGTADVARNDLWLGWQINLISLASGSHTYLWSFIDAPVGSAWGPSTPPLNPALQTANFTPDVLGSYRVQIIVDNSVSEIMICAVRYDDLGVLQNRGWCYPALGEEVGEDNFYGSTRGWNGILDGIFDDILSFIQGGSAGIGVQDNGTTVSGGPWPIMNFAGTGVSVSGSAGVATVTISGGASWQSLQTYVTDGTTDVTVPSGYQELELLPNGSEPSSSFAVAVSYSSPDYAFTLLVTNQTGQLAYVYPTAYGVGAPVVPIPPYTGVSVQYDGMQSFRAVTGGPATVPLELFPGLATYVNFPAVNTVYTVTAYGAGSGSMTALFVGQPADGLSLTFVDKSGAWYSSPLRFFTPDLHSSYVQDPVNPSEAGEDPGTTGGVMTVSIPNASVTWTWSAAESLWSVTGFTCGYVPNEVVPLSDDLNNDSFSEGIYYSGVTLSNVLQAVTVTDDSGLLSGWFTYELDLPSSRPYAVFVTNDTAYPMVLSDPITEDPGPVVYPSASLLFYGGPSQQRGYAPSQPLVFRGDITGGTAGPITAQVFALPLVGSTTTMRLRCAIRSTANQGPYTTSDCYVVEATAVWACAADTGLATLVPDIEEHPNRFATSAMPAVTFTPGVDEGTGTMATLTLRVPQLAYDSMLFSYEVWVDAETLV